MTADHLSSYFLAQSNFKIPCNITGHNASSYAHFAKTVPVTLKIFELRFETIQLLLTDQRLISQSTHLIHATVRGTYFFCICKRINDWSMQPYGRLLREKFNIKSLINRILIKRVILYGSYVLKHIEKWT